LREFCNDDQHDYLAEFLDLVKGVDTRRVAAEADLNERKPLDSVEVIK
jgi:hypothetical protein